MKTKLYRIGALLLLVYAFFLPWPASMGQSGYGGDRSPDDFSARYSFHEYPLDGVVSVQWKEMGVTTSKVEEGVYISYGYIIGDGDLTFALIYGTCLGDPDTGEVACSYPVGSTNLVVLYTPETPERDIVFYVSESNLYQIRQPALVGRLSTVEQF